MDGGLRSIGLRSSPESPLPVIVIVSVFFLLGLVRLGVPSTLVFDENYYVPSAVRLLLGQDVVNREHPMLAKELIAALIGLLGFSWMGLRIGSLCFVSVGIATFAFGAAHWTRTASVGWMTALLLAANFLLFVVARLALIDAYMFGFVGLGVFFLARFANDGALGNLVAGGALLGLAVACKWMAAPVLGFALVATVLRSSRSTVRFYQGFLCLFLLPSLLYWATWLPGALMAEPLPPGDWVALHEMILRFHSTPFREHVYSSNVEDWLLGGGVFWAYAGTSDGHFRALALAFNPALVLPLIAALIWGAERMVRGDFRTGMPAMMAAMYLVFFSLPGRSVQYIHYLLLPSAFASVTLAAMWGRWAGGAGARSLIAAGFLFLPFLYFWPVLSAAPVEEVGWRSRYAFLPGWEAKDGPRFKNEVIDKEHAYVGKCLMHPRQCHFPYRKTSKSGQSD